MIINYKNYSLELISNNNFNMTETIKVEKSKKEGKKLIPTGVIVDKVINHGYSISFEKCIENIINLEISKKHKVIDIKSYIKEYKETKQEILNILK